MKPKKWTTRLLKQKLIDLLGGPGFEKSLEEIRLFPPKLVVNPLFSLFHNRVEIIRWRAVTAMGMVVSDLADHESEAGRVIMRRLMWNLNDESGGIGWGSPEAMGEIMARNERLAGEYHRILVSYIRPDGNFIEHEPLQRGVLWGICRLARARPELMADARPFLVPFLESEDASLRGLAALALSSVETSALLNLAGDTTRVMF